LNTTQTRYEVVVLDAFLGDGVPSHLLTVEMFEAIDQHLAPGGVLVINFFGTRMGKGLKSTQAVYSTLRAVFPMVKAYAENTPEITCIYFCASHVKPNRKSTTRGLSPDMIPVFKEIITHPLSLKVDEELLLTDNNNPIEIWDLKTKETVRKRIQKLNVMELFS
jgi:hypothetical protein